MIDTPAKSRKLLAQLRDKIRVKHYSIRAKQAYIDWARDYILSHNKRHPRQMETPEIEVFLTHLAVGRKVLASTQKQAGSVLLFLHKEVLLLELS